MSGEKAGIGNSAAVAGHADTIVTRPLGSSPNGGAGRRWLPLLCLLLCVGASVAYLLPFMDRGWIPHDEGLLAHSAERLLAGEIPHRDFEDAYTGGLTQLHAVAFRLFGVRLIGMRIVLLIAFVSALPAVYYIAQWNHSPVLAVCVVFSCVAWTLPNYFAGLPSWYVLIFTLLGAAALLRGLDTDRRAWLVAAGACGGLAMVMKITGLYFVAAGLLFLLYRDQVRGQLAHAASPVPLGRRWGGLAFTVLVALGQVSLVVLLIRNDLRLPEIVHFVLPVACLCGFLVWNEWRYGSPLTERWRRFALEVGCFLLGAAVPVLVLALQFAMKGALSDLVYGVFVLPRLRLETAKGPMQPLISMIPVLLPALVVLPICLGLKRLSPVLDCLVKGGLVLIGVLLLVLNTSFLYFWTYFSLRGLLPLLVVAACIWLIRQAPRRADRPVDRQVFLLAAVACLGSLTQYPQSFLIYFLYCAPLVLLLLHALLAAATERWSPTHVGLVAFYLLFALLTLNRGYGLDPANELSLFDHRMTLERAGLRVREESGQEYERAIREIQRLSADGEYIYAAPDCPEVYFLSGRRNPTPTMFDFFDQGADRAERILRTLDEKQIDVVVLNQYPLFSRKVDGALDAALKERFPHRRQIGRFIIAHRTPVKVATRPAPPATSQVPPEITPVPPGSRAGEDLVRNRPR